jgi:hypothetical protein
MIDWEERKWQLASQLYIKLQSNPLYIIKLAEDFLEIYQTTIEKDEKNK